jgi:hypothetical protein
MAGPYPNDQDNPAAFIPVKLVNLAGNFYDAGSGGGGGSSTLAYASAAAATAGTPFAATSSAVGVLCTAAGNVSLQLAGGPLIIPVSIGFTLLPFAAAQINSSGTTAAATYTAINLGTTTVPQAFSSATALTVGVAATPGATLMVVCTAQGSITFTLEGSGSLALPVYPGVLYLPYEVTEITASTATATYFNLS